jgi:hypothetical protein
MGGGRWVEGDGWREMGGGRWVEGDGWREMGGCPRPRPRLLSCSLSPSPSAPFPQPPFPTTSALRAGVVGIGCVWQGWAGRRLRGVRSQASLSLTPLPGLTRSEADASETSAQNRRRRRHTEEPHSLPHTLSGALVGTDCQRSRWHRLSAVPFLPHPPLSPAQEAQILR